VLDRLKTTVGAVVAALSEGSPRGADSGDRRDRSENSPGGSDGPVSTRLYRCSTCEIVYIAAEKAVCSRCQGGVERVSNGTDTE
jgi:hypothetical protein